MEKNQELDEQKLDEGRMNAARNNPQNFDGDIDKLSDIVKHLSKVSGTDLDLLQSMMTNFKDGKIKSTQNQFNDLSDPAQSYLKLVHSMMGPTQPLQSVGEVRSDRDFLYSIYDEMDEEISYVSTALDVMTDDATQTDDAMKSMFIIKSNNEKVVNIVKKMIIRLDLENRVPKWCRAGIKYGDFYIQVVIDEARKMIAAVDDTIHPTAIDRVDLKGNLLSFVDRRRSGKDRVRPPWEYIHFRHKGKLQKEDQYAAVAGVSTSLGNFYGDDYTLSSSYGNSVLDAARRTYIQLRFVETMMLLARLTNSIKRNIWKIKTQGMNNEKAVEHLNDMRRLITKEIRLDLETRLMDSKKGRSYGFEEDIFIPVMDDKNDVTREEVGGEYNVREAFDVEYLQNKLFSDLKVPKAYLNYEESLNARSTLIQLDIRYSRTVSKIQQVIINGVERLAMIELALQGIEVDKAEFSISFPVPSSIEDEVRSEKLSRNLELATSYLTLAQTINEQVTIEDDPENAPSLQKDTVDEPAKKEIDAQRKEGDQNIGSVETGEEAGKRKYSPVEGNAVQEAFGFGGDEDSSEKPKKKAIDMEFLGYVLIRDYFLLDNEDLNRIMPSAKKFHKQLEKDKVKKQQDKTKTESVLLLESFAEEKSDKIFMALVDQGGRFSSGKYLLESKSYPSIRKPRGGDLNSFLPKVPTNLNEAITLESLYPPTFSKVKEILDKKYDSE